MRKKEAYTDGLKTELINILEKDQKFTFISAPCHTYINIDYNKENNELKFSPDMSKLIFTTTIDPDHIIYLL